MQCLGFRKLSEDTILSWSQGRTRASKCVMEDTTRVRRLCVFCWRQLIGSRNKTNVQPVKLIAFSNSTRTGVSEASAGEEGSGAAGCALPHPPDINTTPSHNHNTRYLSWTPYWSYGPSSLDAERVQNRLLLLLSTNVLLCVWGVWRSQWPPTLAWLPFVPAVTAEVDLFLQIYFSSSFSYWYFHAS